MEPVSESDSESFNTTSKYFRKLTWTPDVLAPWRILFLYQPVVFRVHVGNSRCLVFPPRHVLVRDEVIADRVASRERDRACAWFQGISNAWKQWHIWT